MDIIQGFKTIVLGILTTAATVVPVVPSSSPQTVPVKQAVVSPATSSPLPLNGDNYIYVRGNYSYLGQTVKYLFLIPKNGGGFSGSIEGACQAMVGGEFKGGEGGEIFGGGSGTCKIAFIEYKGSVNFKGNLYPESKKIVVEIENSHLQPVTLNFN